VFDPTPRQKIDRSVGGGLVIDVEVELPEINDCAVQRRTLGELKWCLLQEFW